MFYFIFYSSSYQSSKEAPPLVVPADAGVKKRISMSVFAGMRNGMLPRQTLPVLRMACRKHHKSSNSILSHTHFRLVTENMEAGAI